MKMVGVPESSFDFWAAKVSLYLRFRGSCTDSWLQFLAQGYKVGRVDQCETALGAEIRVKDGKKGKGKVTAEKKGIVRRELRSVLTTGTIVDGSMLTDDLASHCVAIKVSLLSSFDRKLSLIRWGLGIYSQFDDSPDLRCLRARRLDCRVLPLLLLR